MTRLKFGLISTTAAGLLGILIGVCATLIVQNVSVAIKLAVSVDVPPQTAPVVGIVMVAVSIIILSYVVVKGIIWPRDWGREED